MYYTIYKEKKTLEKERKEKDERKENTNKRGNYFALYSNQ